MAKKNTRTNQDDTERGESWDSEAQADETRHGTRGDMDRDMDMEGSEPAMPPKSQQPRQPQKKK